MAELGRWVARYVAGECPADEAAAFEQLLVADPALAEQVEAFRQLWEMTDRPRKRRDLDQAWRALHGRLRVPVERPAAPARVANFGAHWTRSTKRRPWVAIAAAVLVVVLPAASLWLLDQRGVTPAADAVSSAPPREYASRPGEQIHLRLPDGSRVVLGAGSRLRIPDDFGTRTRDVTLDGQGYFDVVHDSTLAFRVHTALGVAEDIGTAFVVSTYPEVGGMKVAVASGIVAIPSDTGQVMLYAGDRGRVDSTGTSRVERDVDMAAELAWTRGELAFRRTPLRQVVPQVARWYGIRVRLASPALGDVPVSASFADGSPAQAVAFIAAAVGARLVQEPTGAGADSTFTLYSR